MIGAVIGAAVLGWIAGQVGEWYGDRFVPNAGLEGVALLAIGVLSGIALGAGAGVWIVLGSRSLPNAGLTGGLVAALVPVGAIIIPFLNPLLEDLNLDGQFLGAEPELLVPALYVALVAALVRLFLTSGASRESDATWEQPNSAAH